VRVEVLLNQRCRNGQFYGSFHPAAQVGPGTAKLMLSFPGWIDVNVGSKTTEVLVGEATQPAK
jgi:hypothetical protein